MGRERRSAGRLAKISFVLIEVVLRRVRVASRLFENQGAAIIEGDFLGTPGRPLIDAVRVGIANPGPVPLSCELLSSGRLPPPLGHARLFPSQRRQVLN